MTPGDSDEYSEDDDSEYNEDHYRLSQPRSDALGETWHVLDAQGLQNPEFTGGPSIALCAICCVASVRRSCRASVGSV